MSRTTNTRTRAVGAIGAVALSVLLAGCSAGSSDGAAGGGDAPEASASTPAATPGQASCDLEGALTGTVELTETDDAYEVVFTGLPVDGATDDATFMLVLAGDDETVLSSDFMAGTFRSATATVGVDGERVSVPDAASASGDVVTAVYPKGTGELADVEPSGWYPNIVYSVNGTSDSVRCGNGSVLPYAPLS
jgi:hypothetical protein